MADTTTKSFIRILRKQGGKPNDMELLCELIDEGYVAGTTTKDEFGKYSGGSSTGLTTKGRLFLAELERDEEEEGWRAKAWFWSKILGAFLLGCFVNDFQALGHAVFVWFIALFK